VVAPKITFQKEVSAESLDKQLGQLKLQGKKKKAVESYWKALKTWQIWTLSPHQALPICMVTKKWAKDTLSKFSRIIR